MYRHVTVPEVFIYSDEERLVFIWGHAVVCVPSLHQALLVVLQLCQMGHKNNIAAMAVFHLLIAPPKNIQNVLKKTTKELHVCSLI